VTVNNGPSNTSVFTVTTGPGITVISPTSGGIGATVAIGGAGFGATQGSSTIKFNGTTALPTRWSDTSVTVPVPAGATTGNIVATVGGAASNAVSFTVSSGLSVTSVSPTSGNTGTSVTITGTGFGATQGSSKVTFNGTSSSITAWSNTSITTSVPSAATSGALVVTVGGASSDGTYFVSQPLVDNISPNPAAVDAAVTIAGQNFGVTQGSSFVTCNGTPFPVATWSANSIVMQQGCVQTNGIPPTTVPIQITVNAVSSAMASIQGIPDASLSPRVSPAYASVGTPILVRGQNLGATQGQSTITMNGAAATPTSWSNTAIVVPVPAGAAASGQINVIVGGVTAYPWAFGPTVGSFPTPTSLQITPAGVNMLIGAAQQFVVFDNQGLQRYDATWTIDNTSLASISTNSPTTLTAFAAGTVTLTATVDCVSAQMPVTISALSVFPNGTILWSAPPTPGFSPMQVVQAVPTDFGPASFSVQESTNGGQTLVGAFTADGQEMWQATLGALGGNAVPDGSGGLIVTEACSPANPSGVPMSIVDLDGVTRASLWQAQITSSSNACPPGPPKMAIRQDGLVIVAAPLQTSPALIFTGGAFDAAPAIPPSTITDEFGNVGVCDCYTPVGQPIVDSDGSIYVEYEVRQFNLSSPDISSALWLMQIGLDGSTNSTQLSSSDKANLFPGSLMPDGNGGIVATWTIVNTQLPVAPQPYQAAYVVSGSIVSTYPLPMAPTQVVNGSNGLPINPTFVLGENGVAFVSYSLNVASFNISSGSAIWNYPYTQGVSSISYMDGGGLTLADAQGNQVPIDSGGNAGSAVALSASLLQPSWNGVWQGAFGISNIGLASISAPLMDWGHSFWAGQGGSPSPSGVSKEMSWFPVLPNCSGAQQPCIYNALSDLITRLRDPALSNLAQTNIFNGLGNDANGNQYTTAAFIVYLTNMKPRFYDGLRSTYCSEVLDHSLTKYLCFQNPLGRYTLGLLSTDVKDAFTSKTDALTMTPGNPLLTFFRPESLGSSTSGQNLGNEALIFHEALHGLTGQQDMQILGELGMNWRSHASCSITVRIQNKVLTHSAGLDPSVQWNVNIPCPLVGDE
jgi:IPT/TIG domain-containing protein